MENLTHCPISQQKKRTKLVPVDPTRKKKKPDPNAPKITRPCTECGKRFWSWKALFGHMRCHPDRNWRGINPPPATEESEVATCLLMLANGRREVENKIVNPISAADFNISNANPDHKLISTTNNNVSPYYSSKNSDCLSLKYNISSTNSGSNPNVGFNNTDYGSVTDLSDNIGFESLSRNKVFGSHQARKKNVKGCFAIFHVGGDDLAEGGGGREEREALGHTCGVCMRVFSSGQALGGHMRCHYEKGGLNCLDLNLPAPIEDYSDFNHKFSCFSPGLALDLRLGI